MDDNPTNPIIEICVGTAADALRAAGGGANRIELCTALELGGLTPSPAAIEVVCRELQIPVVVMLRPRAGGFGYDQREFALMQRDVEFALEQGAAGVVFGCLQENGTIDAVRVAEIVQQSGDAETVFHRAFDFVPDPRVALETLIDLGVTRVLTSGQQPTACAGALLIAEMIDQAAGRIEILPAAGIGPHNAAEILRKTGANQLHMGLGKSVDDPSCHPAGGNSCDPSQIIDPSYRTVDLEALAAVRDQLGSA